MTDGTQRPAEMGVVTAFRRPSRAAERSGATRPEERIEPSRLRHRRLEDELRAMRSSLVCSLASLLDLKDLNSGVHSTRLAEWAVRVGKLVGLDEWELRDLETAALLHDIGKMAICDAILQKEGELTEEEYEEVKHHSERGWGVLNGIPGFERVAIFVLYHHERIDGSGYPSGLRGEDIPIGARIVAVVDAFDAMTSSRVYRSSLGVPEAIRRLRQGAGSQFDAEVVELFACVVDSDFAEVASLVDAG